MRVPLQREHAPAPAPYRQRPAGLAYSAPQGGVPPASASYRQRPAGLVYSVPPGRPTCLGLIPPASRWPRLFRTAEASRLPQPHTASVPLASASYRQRPAGLVYSVPQGRPACLGLVPPASRWPCLFRTAGASRLPQPRTASVPLASSIPYRRGVPPASASYRQRPAGLVLPYHQPSPPAAFLRNSARVSIQHRRPQNKPTERQQHL